MAETLYIPSRPIMAISTGVRSVIVATTDIAATFNRTGRTTYTHEF